MKTDEDEPGVDSPQARVLIVGRSQYNILQCADFLNENEIRSVGIFSLKDALKQFTKLKPTHAFFSSALGVAKIDGIAKMFGNALGTVCYVFPEDNARPTLSEIKLSSVENKMNMNISGGGLNRIIETWLKSQRVLISGDKKKSLTSEVSPREASNEKQNWWDKEDVPEEMQENKKAKKSRKKRRRLPGEEEDEEASEDVNYGSVQVSKEKEGAEGHVTLIAEKEQASGSTSTSEEPPKKLSLRERVKKRSRAEMSEILSILTQREHQESNELLTDPEEQSEEAKEVSLENVIEIFPEENRKQGPTLNYTRNKNKKEQNVGHVNLFDDEEATRLGSQFRDTAPKKHDIGSVKVAEEKKRFQETGHVTKEEGKEFISSPQDSPPVQVVTEDRPIIVSEAELEAELAAFQKASGQTTVEFAPEPPAPPPKTVNIFVGENVGFATMKAPQFEGYAIFLTDAEGTLEGAQRADFAFQLAEALKQHLKDHGVNVPDDVQPHVQNITLCQDTVKFFPLFMKNNERGIKFINGLDQAPVVEDSAVPEMIAIDLSRINSELAVNFDLYIRMDLNNKYVKYIVSSGKMSENQKAKLTKKNISRVHIKREDLPKFEAYCLQSFIFGNLDKTG